MLHDDVVVVIDLGVDLSEYLGRLVIVLEGLLLIQAKQLLVFDSEWVRYFINALNLSHQALFTFRSNDLIYVCLIGALILE